jgi:hypothetical protein
VNNAVLVYNFINKGWESVDLIEQNGWDIANFITASPSGINQLFSVNGYGGIHIFDYREDDQDRIYSHPGIPETSHPIESYVKTRMFRLNSAQRKKWNAFELHVESSTTNDSNATVTGEAENVDSNVDLGTIFSLNGSAVVPVGEDASLRGRIGNVRAHGFQFTITPTAGRPKLLMVKARGSEAFRSTTQAT